MGQCVFFKFKNPYFLYIWGVPKQCKTLMLSLGSPFQCSIDIHFIRKKAVDAQPWGGEHCFPQSSTQQCSIFPSKWQPPTDLPLSLLPSLPFPCFFLPKSFLSLPSQPLTEKPRLERPSNSCSNPKIVTEVSEYSLMS